MASASTKRKTKAEPVAAAKPSAFPIVAWKGFDANLRCRDHQFEIGKSYTHTGTVRACVGGFHACENPLDVWSYYGLGESNRFCRVHLSGATDRHDGDSKIAAETILIETEVTLAEMIKAGVEYTVNATKDADDNPSGNYARIGSSGYNAQIGSSGDDAQIGSSGNYARIGSSGYNARIGSSGDDARIGSSGYNAQIGSSGNYAQIGSSGNYAQIGSSGNYARIGSSGYNARIGSSGYNAQIGSSGNYARIGSSGERGVIASAGHNASAKGADGTWISLAEFDRNGHCIGFATGCIGKDGLKADTYYRAQGGKLVEAA